MQGAIHVAGTLSDAQQLVRVRAINVRIQQPNGVAHLRERDRQVHGDGRLANAALAAVHGDAVLDLVQVHRNFLAPLPRFHHGAEPRAGLIVRWRWMIHNRYLLFAQGGDVPAWAFAPGRAVPSCHDSANTGFAAELAAGAGSAGERVSWESTPESALRPKGPLRRRVGCLHA